MRDIAGLEIKNAKNGKGIFANRTFKKGQTLFEVRGQRRHFAYVNLRPGTFQDNTFRFSHDYYLSPAGQLGDFLNHSCEPNAGIVKQNNKLYVIAIENIVKGNEIAIDYSTILGRDDSWTMSCKCGSPRCRRIIKSFSSLPKSLK